MYNINDTIIAVSSGAAPSTKKIIRISGDQTFNALKNLTKNGNFPRQRKIIQASVQITEDFAVDAEFYLFSSPNSYTGEDLAEIHIFGCDEIVEIIFSKLLSMGCRNAEPGEFTYRAFVNGKMDLSRAEAVAKLIESSNQYQLSAAQRLFGGSIEHVKSARTYSIC